MIFNHSRRVEWFERSKSSPSLDYVGGLQSGWVYRLFYFRPRQGSAFVLPLKIPAEFWSFSNELAGEN
jgi:hypothetical protein